MCDHNVYSYHVQCERTSISYSSSHIRQESNIKIEHIYIYIYVRLWVTDVSQMVTMACARTCNKQLHNTVTISEYNNQIITNDKCVGSKQLHTMIKR